MKCCEPISASSKARRGKEINDDREANRAHARGSAEKEPENYFWGGPSAHASVGCWVCSVLWSRTSSYDSDHIAADFQGPATLKVYEGAPHGLPSTHQDRLNADLLAFIRE